ncbi:MAG: F0F1 ATP synthase subunit delta [Gammaproteobacteria bacterium]|nr:F0F1 ATP synthase subunit delta [Gammaproteobacteria bacterium]
MSDFDTIARPYAKAAFQSASELDTLDQWSEFLAFASLTIEDKTMLGYLTNPSILAGDKALFVADVLNAGLKGSGLTQEQNNFIQLLAENNRLLAFGSIMGRYEALKREVDGVVDVKVISARKLTVAQTKAMATKLKQRIGKDVSIVAEVDASLIAGAVIYADDVVIDGTARAKLDKLASALNK